MFPVRPHDDQSRPRAADRNTLLRDFRPVSQLVTTQTPIDRARFPAIDAHAHLGKWLSSWSGMDGQWLVDQVGPWLERMERHNVGGFINLDGRWGEELAENLDHFDAAFPGRVATFAHVDWALMATRPHSGTSMMVEQVYAAQAAGAAGFKVWKDLGLEHGDGDGGVLLPDDERLADVWSAIGDVGLPVWWHIADPTAFFEPVDAHNEYVEMLVESPHWSFHGEEFPRFDRLMEAMEAVVRAHPDISFVGVHAGCYAENLGWVDHMLRTHPHFHIDISARLAQLGRQPRATRSLVMRHPSRVLFGTDQIPPTGEEYPTYFRFLESADEGFHHSADPEELSMGRWPISGLALPDEVLRAVYYENVQRLVPRLTWRPGAGGSHAD